MEPTVFEEAMQQFPKVSHAFAYGRSATLCGTYHSCSRVSCTAASCHSDSFECVHYFAAGSSDSLGKRSFAPTESRA